MGNTQNYYKEREKTVPFYQQFTTDELLLQLSDWYALVHLFGTSDYYERQIRYIERVLRARVRHKNL